MNTLHDRLFIVTGGLIVSWILFIMFIVIFWSEITGTEKNMVTYDCDLAEISSTPIEVRAKCKAMKR